MQNLGQSMERAHTEPLQPQEMSGHGPELSIPPVSAIRHILGRALNMLVFLAVPPGHHHPPYIPHGQFWQRVPGVWAGENDSQKIFSYCSNLR